MKLKEKFLELTNSECEHDSYCKDNDCKYDGQVVCRLNIRKSERCEVIADEFAIGFVKFVNETDSYHHAEDAFHFNDKWHTYEEFLEIYKKNL